MEQSTSRNSMAQLLASFPSFSSFMELLKVTGSVLLTHYKHIMRSSYRHGQCNAIAVCVHFSVSCFIGKKAMLYISLYFNSSMQGAGRHKELLET